MSDDVVRFVVVALAVLTGAAMLTVLFLHFRAWRITRARSSDLGLLPLHVVLISASYSAISWLLALGVLDGLGKPMSWRTPGYGVALAVGLGALYVVGKLQRRRIRMARRQAPLQADVDHEPRS